MAAYLELAGALRAEGVPEHQATFRQLSDLYLLSEGGYDPVGGFLNSIDTACVCSSMHLTTGEPWSIPIIFPIDEATKDRIGTSDRLLLLDGDTPAGVLQIDQIFALPKDLYARSIFRTDDTAHPGVEWLNGAGEHSVAGTVETFQGWAPDIPGGLPISPRDTTALVVEKGWDTVVGFQTRNPIHRAHEFCTKIALETADGLVIHPLLGETKADDTPADVRLACYRVLLDKYYPTAHSMLAGFPAWMRYAGPREAIFHAQVRRNYGITHFIVGRDHAGVGDYYGPFDAQEIFSEFLPGELGIEPVFFDFVHFCRICGGMASKKTCPHAPKHHVHLAGREVRRMLRNGKVPPAEFTRPEVAEILIAAVRNEP